MLRKSMLAAVSLAMLAVAAPASHAAVTTFGCGGVARVTPNGAGVRGVLFGYAAFDDTATHTLRCYVTVDGTAWYSTPTGVGTGAVATAGEIDNDFFVPPGSELDECTEIDGATVDCHPLAVVTEPDADTLLGSVVATVVGLEHSVVDPVLCPILVSLSPGLGPVVVIAPDGDLSLFGTPKLFDCPPYGA